MTTESLPRLYTIGVYGYDAERFCAALTSVQIDLFCDVRARRSVRGSAYAFANSRRLQEQLAELAIRYVHRPELAPSQALRDLQHDHDRTQRMARRRRTTLAAEFVNGYEQEVLQTLDSSRFSAYAGTCRRVVFFCVETAPTACHRSLLSERLALDLGLAVTHLVPD